MPLGCEVVDADVTFTEELMPRVQGGTGAALRSPRLTSKEGLMCRAGSPNAAEVDVQGRPTGK